MSTSKTPEEFEVGRRLRQMRRARNLTLGKLSDLTGNTPGHISRIENGHVKPTPKTLEGIAEALQVEANWLLDDSFKTGGSAPVVVRADQRLRLRYGSRSSRTLGMEDFLLTANLEGEVAMGMLVLQPGGSDAEAPESFAHGIAGFVLEGSIELVLDDEVHAAGPGDCLSFDARIPHLIRNPGDKIARLLWAVAPVVLPFRDD